MKKKNILNNEEGFTLIEIIAVLVILGILAAVAVPKFFSMQEDAKQAAIDGGLGEGAVRFNHAYARYLLDNKKPPADIAALTDATGKYLGATPGTGETVGDFTIKWEKITEGDDSGDLKITITACTTITDLAGLITTKTLSGIEWGS